MVVSYRQQVRSITFDLDGTLVDSIADLADAANAMLTDLALPLHSKDAVTGFVGEGIVTLVQRCLPEGYDATEQAVTVFRRHYAECNGRKARVYPGVVAALQRLRMRSVPMAVVTNKAHTFTLPLLEKVGLAGYFNAVVSGDTLPHKKPHPAPLRHACRQLGVEPERNLHVGDSRHDAESAHAAGCRLVLVPYGYSPEAEVRKLHCDAIVTSLEDLPDWLFPAE